MRARNCTAAFLMSLALGCASGERAAPSPPDARTASDQALGFARTELDLRCSAPGKVYGAWLEADTYRYVIKTRCETRRGRPGLSIDGIGVRTLAVRYRRDATGGWAVDTVRDMTVWRRFPDV